MKRICVLTATRAEYGLLKNVIVKLQNARDMEVNVVATGMHLSPEFGLTYREIEADGIPIHKKIEILLSADSPSAISKTMGLALIQFADYFAEYQPDLLLVLGDRYETLAVCMAAMNQRIPIAHLYGGETTEGAVDEAIRHAITKLSYLHFTSTEEYRHRVIQLGENPGRVFTVGAMGIENIMSQRLMTRAELEESIQFSLEGAYAVVTFHPVTLESGSEREQAEALFTAFDQLAQRDRREQRMPLRYVITKANADAGGRIINEMIDDYASARDTVFAIDSLGMKRYLSALKYCSMVIGNSSSGLLEAPSFHIPTVNIGNRQKGRLQGDTIINCAPETEAICKAMDQARDPVVREAMAQAVNPYGDGNTSDKILEILARWDVRDQQLKKKFYDVTFQEES